MKFMANIIDIEQSLKQLRVVFVYPLRKCPINDPVVSALHLFFFPRWDGRYKTVIKAWLELLHYMKQHNEANGEIAWVDKIKMFY